jgi:hypothetical protein
MTAWTAACVTCAARDRSTPLESGHVCPACDGWMRRTLTDISSLVAQAYAASDRQRVGSSTGKPVFGSRPPLDVECLDADLALVRLTDSPPWPTLLEVLEGWERLVRESRTLAPYGPASESRGGASVHGCVGFLLASADWIVETPDFPVEDYAGELRACLRAVRKWDGDAASRGYAVPCPTMTEDGGECGYRLRFVDVEERVTCRRCQVTRSVPQLVAVGMATATHAMWVDPEAICRHYGIHASTLRRWAARGLVSREHGRYLVSDVERLLASVTPVAQ